MILKMLFLITFISISLTAGEIKIAVSANLSYAIDNIIKEFNRLYPNIKVGVIIGSTGKLTAQIKHGAPYQIFMSADMQYPNLLYKENIAITRPLVYAQGSLAYFSKKKRDFSKNIEEILINKDINKIAIANPKTAPYGRATMELLTNSHLLNQIKDRFVFGESISQTVTYAMRATDIGIIAKSALYSPKMAHFKEGINWSSIKPNLYKPINQGIVILKKGEKNSEVASFYTFIFSKRAKKIFEQFGYMIPSITSPNHKKEISDESTSSYH